VNTIEARPILVEALRAEGFDGDSQDLHVLQIIQAMARFEGGYGEAKKPAGWAETKNWGAIHKGKPPCGDDGWLHVDHRVRPDGSWVEYPVCFKKYATHLDAARDMVRWLKSAIPAMRAGPLLAAAAAIKNAYHYGVTPAEYAHAIGSNAKEIARILGEPYTLDYGSQERTGAKMDTTAILGYILDTDADWQKLWSAAHEQWADLLVGAPRPKYDIAALDADYAAWGIFRDAARSYTFYISDDTFAEAQRWRSKAVNWWKVVLPGSAMGAPAPAPVPTPGGDGGIFGGLGANIGTPILLGVFALGGLYLVTREGAKK
jgi:hypothetical protein